MSDMPYLSVLIPAKNEADNLPGLLEEIRTALGGGNDWEVLVVDDGSTDDSVARLKALRASGYHQLRLLQHRQSLGQSTSIYHAAQAARGTWIVTIDGDGQNDPADIPGMMNLVRGQEGRADGIKLVAGHRVNRRDSEVKRWSSKFANAIRRRLLKDDTPDTGCGLKVIERAMFLQLPYFNHMHRFLPALVQRHKGKTVVHPVNHRHRTAGVSKYGTIDRALVGILDLFGVWWLIRRTKLDVDATEVQA